MALDTTAESGDDYSLVDEMTERQLLTAVCEGTEEAYGELWRRHVSAVTALAHTLVSRNEADELVAEAFTRAIRVVYNGGGTQTPFRTRWCRTVRSLLADNEREKRTRDHQRAAPGIDLYELEAWEHLDREDQYRLYLSVFEQQSLGEAADIPATPPPHRIPIRTDRGRDRRRRTHAGRGLNPASRTECAIQRTRLAAYLRDELAEGNVLSLERHLLHCSSCAETLVDVRDVTLRILLGIAPSSPLTSLPIRPYQQQLTTGQQADQQNNQQDGAPEPTTVVGRKPRAIGIRLSVGIASAILILATAIAVILSEITGKSARTLPDSPPPTWPGNPKIRHERQRQALCSSLPQSCLPPLSDARIQRHQDS